MLGRSPHRRGHFIAYNRNLKEIINNNPSSADSVTYTFEELSLIK